MFLSQLILFLFPSQMVGCNNALAWLWCSFSFNDSYLSFTLGLVPLFMPVGQCQSPCHLRPMFCELCCTRWCHLMVGLVAHLCHSFRNDSTIVAWPSFCQPVTASNLCLFAWRCNSRISLAYHHVLDKIACTGGVERFIPLLHHYCHILHIVPTQVKSMLLSLGISHDHGMASMAWVSLSTDPSFHVSWNHICTRVLLGNLSKCLVVLAVSLLAILGCV